MSLSDRLGKKASEAARAAGNLLRGSSRDVSDIAARLHSRILDRLDLANVSQLSNEDLASQLRTIVEQLVAADNIVVSEQEQAAIVDSVLDEITGLGPIEALLKDPTISDVLVNGANEAYVERHGLLEPVTIRFRDDSHLIHTIQRIVARVGRRIDESSPMVDARLPDGSRVNAVIPPLALDGPVLSIRRFGATPMTAQELLAGGALTEQMLGYLEQAVRSRCTILIAGGTGAGKTTLLNVLSGFIPDGERIITIEDSAELRLAQRHVVRLESRPPNLEGKGAVTIRDLVRNALRMRPDRIVVGEVRGAEVLDMLQAMNTGHEGSLATVHANSAEDAINRLMTMLGMSGTSLPEETMSSMVWRALHVVVHVSRLQNGARRVTGISEVIEDGHGGSGLAPIFSLERNAGVHRQISQSGLADRFRTADQHR